MTAKKFQEDGRTAVFTTKFVLFEKKDITYVTHDEEDGAWQFFSDDHFDNFEEVAKIVALEEIIRMDNTLLDLADMPEGFFAVRKFKGEKWKMEAKK